MHKIDPQKNPFSQHYRQLELNDRADWETARAHYRRLVNLWHPDRFAHRPRERAHAQQQFIKLTISYNALRNFYRKNHRLPFQSAHTVKTDKKAERCGAESCNPDTKDTTVDNSLLGRKTTQRRTSSKKPGGLRNLIWLTAGGSIMLGTVMFFLIVDRSANRAIAERGREIVKEAPPSEFMPSAAEIRRSQTRGAFVKPTQ